MTSKIIIDKCGSLNHLFQEFGNPDDLPSVYSGIRTGLQLENHLIYRPPLVFNNKEVHSALRTVYTDSKWLNGEGFTALDSAILCSTDHFQSHNSSARSASISTSTSSSASTPSRRRPAETVGSSTHESPEFAKFAYNFESF